MKYQTFQDLYAWKQGHGLVLDIYGKTKSFPKEELYGLVSQMRRCAVSITSNIAEGWGRRTQKDKIRFYNIARGSLTELQNQILIARDVGYISVEVHMSLEEKVTHVHKLLNGLISSIQSRIQ